MLSFFYAPQTLRLINSNFILAVAGVSSSQLSYSISSSMSLTQVDLDIEYFTDIQGKAININYLQSRLLQESPLALHSRLLTSITFTSSFTISAFPPATYYPSNTLSFYSTSVTVLLALSVALLILSFILIPKKMHLHSLTTVSIPAQIYILFGLSVEGSTDWIKYSLASMSPTAFLGGQSLGSCCSSHGNYLGFTTELVFNSGWTLLIIVVLLLLLFFCTGYHKRCGAIFSKLITTQYFAVTIYLSLLFTLSYTSFDTLVNFKILNGIDALNTMLGIFLCMVCLMSVVAVWWLSYVKRLCREQIQVSVQAIKSVDEENERNEQEVEASVDPIFKEDKEKSNSSVRYYQHNSHNAAGSSTSSGISEQQLVKQVKTIDENLLGEVLKFDYWSLYQQKQSSKYFLPLYLSRLYLSAIAAAALFSTPFILFSILAGIELSYLLYLLPTRPFQSNLTNLRLILTSFLQLFMDTVMSYYLYNSLSGVYVYICEQIVVICALLLLGMSLLFSAMEQLYGWRYQIWSRVEPCLKATRLLGAKKVYPEINGQTGMDKTGQSRPKPTQDEMDAFYARVIKKDILNKEFKKHRHLR